jgi:hypothetical protein
LRFSREVIRSRQSFRREPDAAPLFDQQTDGIPQQFPELPHKTAALCAVGPLTPKGMVLQKPWQIGDLRVVLILRTVVCSVGST